MNNNKNDANCQPTVYFVVYVIWCAPTNKFYVGVTRRKVEERLQEHKCGKRQFIDKEIQALGWENSWDWWVVEKDIPSNLISAREQWWISFFNSVHPNGYNRTIGGIDYFEFSKESREKLSLNAVNLVIVRASIILKPQNRKSEHITLVSTTAQKQERKLANQTKVSVIAQKHVRKFRNHINAKISAQKHAPKSQQPLKAKITICTASTIVPKHTQKSAQL